MQNNELIAKFLGYSQPHPEFTDTTYWYKEDYPPLAILLFDNDWNWLMEVVENIENLENKRFRVDIYGDICCIIDTVDLYEIFTFNCDTKINVTYSSCVEFIKWYNEQNK